MRPERHSFVHISARWRTHLVTATPIAGDMADRVEIWRRAGHPLVVAASRPQDPPGSIRLGLATPAKERFGLLITAEAIDDIKPPPSLEDARHAAPKEWGLALDTVRHLAGAHGAAVAVYGSLAWQALSGEAFLRPGSDIDLLFDCERDAAPTELFTRLAALEGTPRLDGEWRIGAGAAVSWREYAAAPQEILIKGHGGPWLWPLSRLGDFRSP